ncbi:glycosyltransferase [Nostocoides sp.]
MPAGSTSMSLETARRLGRRGVAVEIFTRATSSADAPLVDLGDGVARAARLIAGPFEGLDKFDLPGQLCAFAAGLMRAAAHAPEGHYDVIHSHYWLSGQVGLARRRAMERPPRAHDAHDGPGQEHPPRRRRPSRAARARDRRGPGRRGRRPRSSPTPATEAARADRAVCRRPGSRRRRPARCRPGHLHARRPRGRARARWAWIRGLPLLAFRRPDPAAQGRPTS